MGSLEYWFGTGDGARTVWTSVADLDLGESGDLDAVRLDFDGDGLVDDAMWDSDGDGAADRAVLDAGTAGVRHFADPAGDGVWGGAIDPPSSVPASGAGPAEDVSSPVAAESDYWVSVDYDGDGAVDDALADFDGDGAPDVVLISTRDPLRHDTVLVAEEDPARMTVRLSDTDGNGRLDAIGREPR